MRRRDGPRTASLTLDRALKGRGVMIFVLLLLQAWAGVVAGEDSQTTEDKVAMLELKAAWQRGTAVSLLSTWSAVTEPCDTSSWYDHWSGWLGVACDRDGGRVAFIALNEAGVSGSVAYFAPLDGLQSLQLSNNIRVTGNINTLATLTGLRELDLSGTSVHGSVESLGGLTLLGQAYSLPRYVQETHGQHESSDFESNNVDASPPFVTIIWESMAGALRLGGTNVYGDVFALRNSTALGEDWGLTPAHSDNAVFRACADFTSNQTCSAGASLVPNASDKVGRDECACCKPERLDGRLSYERNDHSGICSVLHAIDLNTRVSHGARAGLDTFNQAPGARVALLRSTTLASAFTLLQILLQLP